MDSEDEDLQRLVASRLSRPAFSRILSLEANTSQDFQAAGKSIKQGQIENADLCGIFNTEENQSRHEPFSDSISDHYSSMEEELNELNIEGKESEQLNKSSSCEFHDSTCTSFQHEVSQRKRKLSKKQKKKRKLTSSFVMPFSCLENLDDLEICDLSESVVNTTIIPSLMELCVAKLWREGRRTPVGAFNAIPRPIQYSIIDWKHEEKFTKVKLSILYHILGRIEKWNKVCKKVNYSLDESVCLTRSVWSCELGNHRLPSAYIPFFYACLGTNNSDTNVQNPDMYTNAFGIITYIAATIDFSLPAILKRRKKGKQHKGLLDREEDCDHQLTALTEALEMIRMSWTKKYPFLCAYFFDEALPYVYWVRGKLKRACHEFMKLAQKNKSLKVKGIFYLEVARVCAWTGEISNASRLIGLASCSKASPEIHWQTLVLTASLYDQGSLTLEKANQSLFAWSQVLQGLKAAPRETDIYQKSVALKAVESIVCFHLAKLLGSHHRVGFERLIQTLEPCENFPVVGLALSLLSAWRGDSIKAAESYLFLDIGKWLILSKATTDFWSPWHAVIAVVKEHSQLKPLEVAWRVQLGHLRIIDSKNVFEADICSADLNHRLSESGQVTADLQMLTPPMGVVSMDPYTGELDYPQLPGQSVTFKSLPSMRNINMTYSYGNLHTIPVRSEVYKDDQGNTMQLTYAMGSDLKCHERTPLMKLVWKSDKGQRADLNILQLLRARLKEKVCKKIMEDYANDDNFCKTANLVTDYLYNHKLDLDGNKMVSLIMKYNERRRKNVSHGRSMQTAIANQGVKEFSASISSRYIQFGQTLLITGTCSENYLYHIFIRGECKESFSQPNVIFFDSKQSKSNYNLRLDDLHSFMPSARKNIIPRADVIWLKMEPIKCNFGLPSTRQRSGSNDILVYNGYGELKCRLSEGWNDVNWKSSVILYGMLFAVSQNQTMIVCNPLTCEQEIIWSTPMIEILQTGLTDDQGENIVPVIKQLSKLVDKLLVFCEEGIIVMCRLTLQPLIITLHCTRPSIKVSVQGTHLVGPFKQLSVLEEKLACKEENKFYAAVGIDYHLVVFSVHESPVAQPVEIILSIQAPGHPTEVSYLGPLAGLLMACTHHTATDYLYRETVFHINWKGDIVACLPLLGPGPRSFLPVWLPENQELTQTKPELGKAGYYVYMRDGHEGIIAVHITK